MRRNLAIYKLSGEPWTQEELDKVYDYTGSRREERTYSSELSNKFIFDDGDQRHPQHTDLWSMQEDDSNFKNCKQVAYEEIFNKPKFNYYIKAKDD